MSLDELAPFEPRKRIIEYVLGDVLENALVNKTLTAFANQTASESPAPGGGSVAAYVGALGVSLGTMVANLSSHKKGWDDRWIEFSDWAQKGQEIKSALLKLVDEDTLAFNAIMNAFALPKSTDEEKKTRSEAIQSATKHATEIPFRVMELSYQSFDIIEAMAKEGNPNSVSDAGVGALCCRTAVYGAYLNVLINAGSLKDETFKKDIITKAEQILKSSLEKEQQILELVKAKM
jgi:glutamate formiminotransferase/formiminotetrahydrofolate cyclodeaminase